MFVCGLAAWVAIPVAVAQDKPARGDALDPRLKPLVGTWEGRVQLKNSREEQGRVLVVRERAGQLEARFGVAGRGLERVVLSTELDGERPTISFKNRNGNLYTLELVREDWLSGKMTLSGGDRGPSSADRPIELERKK
jgi:hypothetical protein